MSRSITLSRRELYDLVWSKPMREVAADLGISDVGLSKVCDRHRVPRPEQGHWNKKLAGQKVKQTIFAESGDQHINQIEIRGGFSQMPEEARAIFETARSARKAISKITASKPAISSLTPVVEPYGAIVKTAKVLRKELPDRNGGVSAFGEGLCGVDIAAERVERAIAFLDALARTLDKEGLPITAKGRTMSVSSGQEEAIFTLKERTRQEKHSPTGDELVAEEKRQQKLRKTYETSLWFDPPGSRAYPEFDTVYTGEFIFQIEGYGDGARRTWADGKTRVIDNLVDDIAVGIRALLAARNAARERREAQQRTWQEFERRRALASLREKREEKRLDYLQELFDVGHEIARLRVWLACHEDNGNHKFSDFGRLMVWAQQRLSDLEAAILPWEVNADLQSKKLFPEIDELADPL